MQRIAAIFVGILLLFFLLVIGTSIAVYPGLIKTSQAADACWIEVEAQYKERAAIITKIAGSADNAGTQWAAVLEACAAAGKVKIEPDQAGSDPEQLSQYEAAQSKISTILASLPISDPSKTELGSNALAINAARKKFDGAIDVYNKQIGTFPTKLITRPLGFPQKPRFKTDDGL